MTDHTTIYERVYFDAEGEPFKWERSFDRQMWNPVQHFYDKPPFILLKPTGIPMTIESEIWEASGVARIMREKAIEPVAEPAPPEKEKRDER